MRPSGIARGGRRLVLAAAAAALALAGPTGPTASAGDAGEEPGTKLSLTSAAFAPGGAIPRRHTGEGEDVSPPLAWTGVPRGTVELVLLCEDPDAPTPEPWVHWVLYGIPADRTAFAEGDSAGAVEGATGWGAPGYRGPMPPRGHGVHRYFFRLYALDRRLDLQPGASRKRLLEAMEGHVLAEGVLVGTYERK